MKKVKKRKLYIRAVSLDENSDFFEIKISGSKKINALLQQFNYEYHAVAENLRIFENRLVLLNPLAVKD
jgi:hypothetical protein